MIMQHTILFPTLCHFLLTVSEWMLLFDKYKQGSLQEQTRKASGNGSRRWVTGSTTIPKDWALFLKNSDNKDELFNFLAQQLAAHDVGDKKLYATFNDRVLSTSSSYKRNIGDLDNCNHEEADTHMILHAASAGRHGHSVILIRTVETDVVVLASAMFRHKSIIPLKVAFGAGKHYRLIPIYSICTSIGTKKSDSLYFFTH